jgi:hypothetical protein
MNEQQRLRLLQDNPALIDIDVDCEKIFDGFLERLKTECGGDEGLLRDYFSNRMPTQLFSSIFSGPLVYAKDGFEKYTSMPDLLAFFFTLAMRLPQGPQQDQFYEKIWSAIRNNIVRMCDPTNALYDSLIKIIDSCKLNKIDNSTMLDILNGIEESENVLYCNMSVFTDYVHLGTIGQLLNHVSTESRLYETHFIYCEMMKGLRDDKLFGIPSSEIVSFFMNQSDEIILKHFDIEMLVDNIYIELFKLGDLDKFVEMQNKNIEYRYSFIKEGSASLSKEDVSGRLVMHYTNLKKIFERLISLKTKSGDLAINSYTIAYILKYVPQPSFFVYSSYEKLYKEFDALYCGDANNRTARMTVTLLKVAKILTLNPNINIPLEFIKKAMPDGSVDSIIEGLRLGFARYALYVTDRFCNYFVPNNEEGCSPDEEFPNYINSSFLDRINFILNEVELLDTENEDDQRLILKESQFYKEINFKETLDRTNQYINALKSMT